MKSKTFVGDLTKNEKQGQKRSAYFLRLQDYVFII